MVYLKAYSVYEALETKINRKLLSSNGYSFERIHLRALFANYVGELLKLCNVAGCNWLRRALLI